MPRRRMLGDLFDAAARAAVRREDCGLSTSGAITKQAHVFDAIAKVITADDDNTALVEGLLDLVRDDDLLPDMKRPRRVGRARSRSSRRRRYFAS